MLAVVISIANQTLKVASSPAAFSEALLGRLHAMSRAYGILSRDNWTEASVEEIIRQEIAPFGMSQASFAGPEVRLKPQQGLSLGMIIHELTTNAAKHGALSTLEGKVGVIWGVSEGVFRLDWRERGGPVPVTLDVSSGGFGLNLVKGEVRYRLGGDFTSSSHPQGFTLCLSFPLTSKERDHVPQNPVAHS